MDFSTMNSENHKPTHSKAISHAFFTGTAKQGSSGSAIGLVDIGVSEIAYFFRVSLPGIEKNLNKIKLEIQREGKVRIQGVIPEIAIPSESGCLYRMQVHQLCPPGPFSIKFSLPGQVDPRLFKPNFRPDGILEVVVVKLGGVRLSTLQFGISLTRICSSVLCNNKFNDPISLDCEKTKWLGLIVKMVLRCS